MSAPVAVNTADGTCWTRRGETRGGEALYAPEGVCNCPPFVMATLAELAEHGIVGSADVLPVPPGPESQGERLSIARIAEIQQRVDAATPGPWGFYDGDNYADVAADLEQTSRGSYSYREKVARLEDENYWDDPAHEDHDEERAPEQMAANAAFIAHAREDMPALLAELSTVRAELRVARGRVAELEAGQENPLAFAEKLDAKSLDNFLIALSTATEYEPMDGAIAQIHELIASYREGGDAR